MSAEIEKRFKNFDYKTIKQLLEKANINKVGGQLFHLTSYVPLKPHQTIRTRSEGDKITFTIKQKANKDDKYDIEYEVNVSDYDMINKILEQLDIKKRYHLEKFREIYADSNNEVIFDHFPGLGPYMEIESKTEPDLFGTMKKLGLEEEENFTAKDLYWVHYGITKERKDNDLTFDNAEEMLGPFITKNKEEFLKILNHQRDFLKKYQKKHSK